MLAAIGVGQTALGLALILAFSLGLAGILTGIGLLFLYGGRLMSRAGSQRLSALRPLLRALPVFSAVIVLIAGLLITRQALIQAGLLS